MEETRAIFNKEGRADRKKTEGAHQAPEDTEHPAPGINVPQLSGHPMMGLQVKGGPRRLSIQNMLSLSRWSEVVAEIK